MSTSTNSTENTSNNPVVSVTNNSGVDVDIFDVFDPNPEGQQGSYQYTKLAKVSNGQTANIQTLRNASQLLATYSGKISLGGNSAYYEKFPVASKGVSVLDNPPYAWSILADDYAGSQQAFQFIKFTSANPASNIAKGFITALQQNDDGASVNKYFAGSASFAKATFESWSQVVFWQTQSLSAWQGSYFLYNVPKAGEKIQQMAAVSITSDSNGTTGSLYLPDDKGVIQTDAKKYSIKPSGTGAIVLEDSGGSDLALSLTPAWVTILTITNPGADGYPVGGSLSGTLNNDNVVGTGQKLPPQCATPVPISILLAGDASHESAADSSTSGNSSGGNSSPLLWNYIVATIVTVVCLSIGIIVVVKWRSQRNQQRIRLVNNDLNSVQNKEQINQQQEEINKQFENKLKLFEFPVVLPNLEYFEKTNLVEVYRQRRSELENLGLDYTIKLDSEDLKITIDGKPLEFDVFLTNIIQFQQKIETENMIDNSLSELKQILENTPPTDALEESLGNLIQCRQLANNGNIADSQKYFENFRNSLNSFIDEEQEARQMTPEQLVAAQKISNSAVEFQECFKSQKQALEKTIGEQLANENKRIEVNNFQADDNVNNAAPEEDPDLNQSNNKGGDAIF